MTCDTHESVSLLYIQINMVLKLKEKLSEEHLFSSASTLWPIAAGLHMPVTGFE